MPSWAMALLAAGAALLAVGTKVGSWWRGRSAAKERARLEAEVQHTMAERDAVQGELHVANAQTEALTEHVEAQTAAVAVAREVDNAANAGKSAADRIAAVDAWVRTNADKDDTGPRQSGTPPVRKR